MSAEASDDVALLSAIRTLALLGGDDAAKRGLQAVVRAGRRHGMDTVQFAGVTISSSRAKEADSRHGGRGSGASGGQSGDETPPQKPKRRRKATAAKRAKDAERHRAKRMKNKLLAIMPILNRVMSAHAQQGQEPRNAVALPQHRAAPAFTFGAEQQRPNATVARSMDVEQQQSTPPPDGQASGEGGQQEWVREQIEEWTRQVLEWEGPCSKEYVRARQREWREQLLWQQQQQHQQQHQQQQQQQQQQQHMQQHMQHRLHQQQTHAPKHTLSPSPGGQAAHAGLSPAHQHRPKRLQLEDAAGPSTSSSGRGGGRGRGGGGRHVTGGADA